VTRPCIALTCGEPAGIGPDLCIMTAAEFAQRDPGFDVICLADAALLRERAAALGTPLPDSKVFQIHSSPLHAPVQAGKLDVRNARWVLGLLDTAYEGCRDGSFSAMCTAPVQKSIINDAGITFTGHTEYLAERSNTPLPVMMLVCDAMRVALATIHLPLAEVPRQLTRELLTQVLRITHQDLQQRFGLANPRIAVCGLNPHAGEGGHLGREEIDIIKPAIEAAQQLGMRVTGPWPADTIFTPRQLREADVVLAMYHDQGLPTLKYAGFGTAVNVTLGLPFIRTSVDHGTALDLAGSGRADCGSLLAALKLAANMASATGQARS
jgi:4-hydroxythreonine-4-phosphate dehydrogenase